MNDSNRIHNSQQQLYFHGIDSLVPLQQRGAGLGSLIKKATNVVGNLHKTKMISKTLGKVGNVANFASGIVPGADIVANRIDGVNNKIKQGGFGPRKR